MSHLSLGTPLFVATKAGIPPAPPLSVALECAPYVVDLRTAWKTSHSVSTQRKNALLTAEITTLLSSSSSEGESSTGTDVIRGFGEVGMPPKNPLAGYFADYDDIFAYTNDAVIATSPRLTPAAVQWLSGASTAPPAGCAPPTAVVTPLSPLTSQERDTIVLLVALLRLHDTRNCTRGFEQYAKAERFGRSGVEGAIVDVLGKVLGAPSHAVAEAWVEVIFATMRGGCDGDMPVKEYLVDMSLFRSGRFVPSHEFCLAASSPSAPSAEEEAAAKAAREGLTFVPLNALCFFHDRFVKKFIAAVRKHTQPQPIATPSSGVSSSSSYKGFLTVGMADPAAMAAGVTEALTQTRFIKIKLDGDERLTYDRLMAVGGAVAAFNAKFGNGKSDENEKSGTVEIVIDANCAWSPEKTTRFAANVGRLRDAASSSNGTAAAVVPLFVASEGSAEEEEEEAYTSSFATAAGVAALGGRTITLIEQPYAADFVVTTDADRLSLLPAWAAVRAACNAQGLQLFADESVCSVEDLPALLPYVNGVNIKLEKCGGLLSAFEFVKAAEAEPAIAFTWVGIMVGSRLLCNNAGQLLVRTRQGDVDGALLLTEASQQFAGGFEWVAALPTSDGSGGGGCCTRHGTIVLDGTSVGVGCNRKPEFC